VGADEDLRTVHRSEVKRARQNVPPAVRRQVMRRDRGRCVESDELAVAGEHAGIDFQHGGVSVNKSAIKSLEEGNRGIGDFARQAKAERDLAGLIRLQANGGMNRFAQDGVGVLLGDFLDFHAAGSAGHKNDVAGGAIDKESQIKFALDVETFFDEQALDDAAGGAGLRSDQLHA